MNKNKYVIDDEIIAVKDLNTESGVDWKIEVKVHKKNELKKAKNGDDLLNLELVDKYGTFISATAFRDDAIRLNE